MRRPSLFAGALALATAFIAWPLWAGKYLPFVDLPQHLHLINVLGHLDDPSTLYPEFFKARGTLTPYLGYYEAVLVLARALPVFAANQLFLTLVVALTGLSAWALLRALGRDRWLALLALPLFYGDNLYWGFINYCAALPLLLFSLALFVRILEQPVDPKYRREVGLALLLLAVQFTHIQAFFYAALALPLLLAMTPSDQPRRLRAVAASAPGALVFAIYSIGRLGDKPDVAPGAPWHAWGPIFSKQNLSFNPVQANWAKIPELLANGLRDNSDRSVVYALGAVAVLAAVLWAANQPPPPLRGGLPRLRPAALALLALAMELFLPFDIRGYIYYVNYRFAELFALLLIAVVPMPGREDLRRAVGGAALLVCAWYGITLHDHFVSFSREADAVDTVAQALPPKPKVMALSYDTNSAVASHPVYLHFASYAAMARGGITSFSFAATPHSPVAYRGEPPPAPPSEWRADQFDYPRYGSYYDAYLVRGAVPPTYTFRGRVGEVEEAARSGAFTLYVRRH